MDPKLSTLCWARRTGATFARSSCLSAKESEAIGSAMVTLRDYESADYWASVGWMAPWLRDVDPAYWREMVHCIGENRFTRASGWEGYVLTDAGREKLRGQLLTRLSQTTSTLVPWLAQALKMDGLRVLEIGCGSGSSTAGLAHAGAKVTAFDIKGPSLVIARKRLELLKLKADVIEAEADWLEHDLDAAMFPGPYDMIMCYAVLEHLTIAERLHLLELLRQVMRRDKAMLAIFETPNRFAPFDWHSTKLPFADVLPDELHYHYGHRFAKKAAHPSRRSEAFTPELQKNIYRAGRGVSWHEFHIAFGMENIEVILDGYSAKAKKMTSYRPNEAFEEVLAQVFAAQDPPVPRGFCRPSLELLLKLKPEE